MTLYRKYRSQKLSELVGQPQISSMLGQAIVTKRIAHAYLFSGPRGTGKTSVARILAKAINCQDQSGTELPCNECANCIAINQGAFLDVVEIDAASHRGIDDVRELVEQAQSVPSIGQYKVYILDEVHMFTRDAFNALLKTLEEPPAHVVIILCTTESHKVPVTITSRCQRFVFNGANPEQLGQLLEGIAQKEDITIESEAVGLLAQLADGGYRDGVMLLDQVISSVQHDQKSIDKKHISKTDIEQQLGLANQEIVHQIIEQLIKRDSAAMIESIENFAAGGGEVRYLSSGLINQLRDLLFYSLKSTNIAKSYSEQQQAWLAQIAAQTSPIFITRAIKNLAMPQTGSALHPALAVELGLLESIDSESEVQVIKVSKPELGVRKFEAVRPVPTPEATSPKSEMKESVTMSTPIPEPPQTEPQLEEKPAVAVAPVEPPADLAAAWQQTLTAVVNQNKSVGALLRHHCTPISLDGTILLLQFWNSFHKKQVELDKNRIMIEELATTIFGHPIKLRGELADKSLRPKKQPMTEEDLHNVAPVEPASDLVDTALEMFGGELVEEQ